MSITYLLKKGILFIHVPKAAGTTLYKSFDLYRIRKHATVNYLQIKEGINLDDYWIVSTVRHPWKRIWSLYCWTRWHPQRTWHKKSWKEWLFSPEVGPHYHDIINNNPLQQKNYFLDKDGNLAADEIIRVEHLKEDVERSEHLPKIELQSYNRRKPIDKSFSGDGYLTAYDDEMKEYVGELCEWEINKFGYKYEIKTKNRNSR